MKMTDVVWLANNITHYHRARADAFAMLWGGRFTVLQLSAKDELPVLERGTCDVAEVETLFPGQTIAEIKHAAIGQAVLRYLERSRPGVCCLNGWAMPGTAAMLNWAVKRGMPCVLMSDSNRHDFTRSWWKEQVKRQFISECGAALVAGRWSREYLIELGMDSECIVDGYDVVDNGHFSAGAQTARRDQAHFRAVLGLPDDYFLACARFEPKKNFRRLIEGYALYAQQAGRGAWKLVIAGDGPSRGELESLARDLGVGEEVVFAGLRTYEELPAIYGLARAFVHASTTEQWGLVVNEAMASGLPVLVSERCGCVSDLVKNGENGFTFNPWNAENLAEKISAIYSDSTLRERMGQRSKEIIADWGPERFAKSLRRAVECALEHGPRKGTLISRAVVRLMAR